MCTSRPSPQNQTSHSPPQLRTQKLLIFPSTVCPTLGPIVVKPVQAVTRVETAFHVGPGADVLNIDKINILERIDVVIKLVLRLSHLSPVWPESSSNVLNENSAESSTVLVNGVALLTTTIPVPPLPQKDIPPILSHRQPGCGDVAHFLGW